MVNSTCFDFSAIKIENKPFLHFCSTSILRNGLENQLFEWFENTSEWRLTEMDFYTQYEFSLLEVHLPTNLACLVSNGTIEQIQDIYISIFDIESFELVGITAHKLVDGHRIKVHNDYFHGEETHRLVIQINPSWNESKGGFLMLFNSSKAEDVSKIVKPLNNSAFGFEISDRSYHAVSTVYDFARYTIVYTFNERSSCK